MAVDNRKTLHTGYTYLFIYIYNIYACACATILAGCVCIGTRVYDVCIYIYKGDTQDIVRVHNNNNNNNSGPIDSQKNISRRANGRTKEFERRRGEYIIIIIIINAASPSRPP